MKKVMCICLLLCLPGSVANTSCVAVKNTDNGASAGKIRAGYMGTKNIDVLGEMAESGMNLALVKFGDLHTPMQAPELELLVKWAKACQQAGVGFMPVINLWGYYEKYWIRLRYHLYYNGIEFGKTPCPLEAEVYKLAVHERVLELARLSRSVPIEGVAIDLEMYAADMTIFPDYCLCDYCFERFLAGRAVSKRFAVNMRQNYLVKSKQVDAYRTFTADSIAQLAQNTKEQLEAIVPDFMIAVLHLDLDKTYNRGLAKGLGSGRRVVLAFTEQTYSTGYSDYIRKTQRRFDDSRANAKLVVGIWQDEFPPENLAEQYYHCAKDSAGYWIYSMESLSKLSGLMTLPFSERQYWQAIRKANNELQKLEVDPGYKSTLQIRSFQTLPKSLNTMIDITNLQYARTTGKRLGKLTDSKLRFRKKVTLVFVAEKGDELKFEIALREYGRNRLRFSHVALTNSSGKILARSSASFQRNAELRTTAPYTGSYALIFDSGGNSSQVVSYSHPFSIALNKEVNLLKPNQSLYFWKPPGSSSAKIVFGVDGFGESVIVTFKNEAGKVLGVYDVVSRHTITVPLVKSRRGEIIELKIRPRPGTYFEDVLIKIETGLEKYVSPFREAVVRASL